MDLTLRRILLFFLSVAFGIAGLFGIIGSINFLWPEAYVTLERYGTIYSIVTAVPLMFFAAVWLDYFMGTELLPEGMQGEDAKE